MVQRIDPATFGHRAPGRASPWGLLLACIAVAAIFALWLGEGPGINTGDWDRATAPAGFVAPPWQPMQEHYTLEGPARFANSGSVGVLLSALGLLAQHTGHATLATAVPLVLLLCTALAGVFFLITGAERVDYCVTLPALLAVLICYLVYLKSFYDEAIILAFTPLLCVSIRQLVRHNRYLLFTVAAVAIIYAKQQMLFVAPIIVLLLARNLWLRGATMRLWVSLACILVASVASAAIHPENRAPNQYNRYFNGIGWSLLDSAGWPATRFDDRHPYFYAHQDAWQARLPNALPFHEYLGTSYLPTASTILDESRDPDLPASEKRRLQALYDALVQQGRLRSYAATLLHHPGVMAQVVKNTYRSTARSNYIIAYARSASRLPAPVAQWLDALKSGLTRIFGLIFLLALTLAFVARPSGFAAAVMLWMALGPLAVVAGDGFFEFEKHLSAFFVFLPAAVTGATLHPRKAPRPGTAAPWSWRQRASGRIRIH